MSTRKEFQASNPARRLAKRFGLSRVALATYVKDPPVYPEVPAAWPNRAIRRAVKQRRMSRVPAVWLAAFTQHKDLKVAVARLP